MNDFSTASISKLIVHLIGNKSKDEDMILSSQLSETIEDSVEQYLNQFFFSSFKFDLSYQFSHESDINLNEIYNYSSKLFQRQDEFLKYSIDIAKHLYEVSTHPNIKKGELYIAYINNCIIDDIPTNVIGIFKSETKDVYLDIVEDYKKINISCKKGININKLDKGCLICDMGTKLPQKIFIVDTNRNDTHYWKKLFLNAVEVEDGYTSTSTVLNTCKQFVKKSLNYVQPTDKISLLNSSLEYFETHDSFEIEDFSTSVFKDEVSSSDFKKYLSEAIPEKKFDKPFDISPKAITLVKKSVKNFIKLDSNIEIRIKTQPQAMDRMMEKGYDEDKQMSYYKIYFKTEE